MNTTYGIRLEDKNEWERRTPLVPEDVRDLAENHGLTCQVQASPLRVFEENEYIQNKAQILDDLSGCPVVFGVKEFPFDFLRHGKTYVFFSHTIKGQAYNMPLLKKIMEQGCTLIDYERMIDQNGARVTSFSRFAGIAGMIDSLWALGQRLETEGLRSPFGQIKRALEYSSLQEAKDAVIHAGEVIKQRGLPSNVSPLVCGFAGYGKVSGGAQEIYDLLPVEEVGAADLETFIQDGNFSHRAVYKTVFKEVDMVRPRSSEAAFELNDYYRHPEKYESQFSRYLPHLTMLINGVYWDQPYPHLVEKKALHHLFAQEGMPRLRVIGDVSCDIEGAVECTVRSTDPGNPVYVYDPEEGSTADGVSGRGVVIMAVDNLPCELPRESSSAFSNDLKDLVPEIVKADYSVEFARLALSDAIKKAVIVHQGKLTPDYRYLEQSL